VTLQSMVMPHITGMPRGDGFDRLYEVIGERVAQARSALQLSQAKLAVKVGVTRASIVNIEHGRQRAPIHLLWRISRALDREVAHIIPTAHELADGAGTMHLSAKVVAAIERAAQDDPEAHKLLTAFIAKATTRMEGENAGEGS
jgi:transcriptional regulator with XRE-family HTH domain